jgi:hypothetical protein
VCHRSPAFTGVQNAEGILLDIIQTKGMLGAFSSYSVHKLLRTTATVQSQETITASHVHQDAEFFCSPWFSCTAPPIATREP